MAPDCAFGRRLHLAQLCTASLSGLLLVLVACTPAPADPPAVISYDSTPRPIPSETLRPTFTRIRSTRVAGVVRTATPRPTSGPPPLPPTIAPAGNPPTDATQPPAQDS